MDNYYKILNIREGAPQEVIRAAYKALSMVYHPDRNGSVDANEVMQKINVAYSVLSVPEKRKAYDRILLENSFGEDWLEVNHFDKHEPEEERTSVSEEELKSEPLKNIIEQLQKKQTLKEHYKRFEEVTQQKEQKTFDEESWQQQKAQWDKEHEDFRKRHQEEFRRSHQSSQYEEFLNETESLCARKVNSKVNEDLSIAVNKKPEATLVPQAKVIQHSYLHDAKLESSGPLQIKTETKAEVPIVVDDRREPALSRDFQNQSTSSSQLHGRNDVFTQKEEKEEQHTIGVNINNAAKHKSEHLENEDRYLGLSFNELRWVIIAAYLIFSYFLIMGNEWYTYWTSEPHKQEVQTTKLDGAHPINKAIEELPTAPAPVSDRKRESYREKLIRNQVF